MRNYVAPGANITITAPEDMVSGQGYVVGSIFGVSAGTYAEDDKAVIHLVGIYEFDGAGSVGNPAYWDDEDKVVAGASATGLYAIGTIVGVNGTKRQVRLDGTAVTAVPGGGG